MGIGEGVESYNLHFLLFITKIPLFYKDILVKHDIYHYFFLSTVLYFFFASINIFGSGFLMSVSE